MPVQNLLMPWRWKGAVHGFFDAKMQPLRDMLVAAIHANRAMSEAQLSDLRMEVEALAEETDAIRQLLSVPTDEASFSRFRSAANDIHKGLSAIRNEIAAELKYSLRDMSAQLERMGKEIERLSG